jgi:hypothetical protein
LPLDCERTPPASARALPATVSIMPLAAGHAAPPALSAVRLDGGAALRGDQPVKKSA